MPARPKKDWPFRIEYPPELPISARVDEIVTAIQQNQVVVLAGETGSGKTTQIPKMCLTAGCGERGRIACTQPRRVAATSVSRRVAEELGVTWGREVGCKIRFADQTSRETGVKFMTDGMLLAELQADPELSEYDTVIVDEAHERSLNIDFILGHLRRLRERRPDLKIVITSATIDTEAFSKAFGDAPVVEVSGRLYPVEVIWSPLEEMRGEREEFTYIDAAVESVGRILEESDRGDVLVFLPTERDIREAGDLLGGRAKSRDRSGGVEIVPLFGRLTNAEQQRVFAPAQRRKIVLATNIAETSLTIPGIRFVVDTGVARVSRYAPQSRTRRLPIEPVSRSSADQRKGRCGRVSDGVCIRLYAEPDFNDRPRFTQPEIQRSNLADVILRMKAFGLGDIESFPFLNAPPAKGIRAGYALLEELGAIERGDPDTPAPVAADSGQTGERGPEIPPYNLTALGRELAALPVDPTIGRMILQAREEKALREVLVIAAALSIQDPRERPLDQQAKADAAHRRFVHRDSDFLTLLAIWEAYHDEFESMTLGKLRKFCSSHFLSFMRMREWRDVHAQLVELFSSREGFEMTSVHDGLDRAPTPSERGGAPRAKAMPVRTGNSGGEADLRIGTPAYTAIHRSILSGLLGNLATRADDGSYRATHDRRVAVFPGSALFERPDRKSVGLPDERGGARKRPAQWLMAAEIMETGRVYARTCARVDPRWAVELGGHLLRVAHSEPFWNAEAGRVLVKERRRLYNLELDTRSVGYGRIDPEHATEIFIREGLVGDTITWPFDFIRNNRGLRERVEAVLARTRSPGYMNLDEAIYRFYAVRIMPVAGEEAKARDQRSLERAGGGASTGADSSRAESAGEKSPGVSSVPELIDLVRHRQTTEPKFLFMTENDLKPPPELVAAAESFPQSLPIENRVLPLAYAYKPGNEDDGVTLRVGLAEAETLDSAALDWAVPGHLREKLELMLKALPKELRRGLIPLAETAEQIAVQLRLIAGRAPQPTLAAALAGVLTDRLGVRIDPSMWGEKTLPDHLRVRVEIVDAGGKPLCSGRDFEALKTQLAEHHREVSRVAAKDDSAAWKSARAKWETPAADRWTFGDVPEKIVVAETDGVPVLAFPGLVAAETGAAVRLFATAEEAREATRAGLRRLLALQLRHELGWLGKELRDLRQLGALSASLGPLERLQEHALESIGRWACDRGMEKLTGAGFERVLASAKMDLRGVVPRLIDLLREILTLRLSLQTAKKPYPGLEDDLAELVPADVVRRTPYDRLAHLPRYLKAMQLRVERWKRDPAKDSQRARELQPFVQAVKRLGDRAGELRWLVQEFRVSLFAQELGTPEPVSAVRLERALKEIAREGAAAGAQREGPAPRVAVPLPTKGKTVFKSLDALGNLLR